MMKTTTMNNNNNNNNKKKKLNPGGGGVRSTTSTHGGPPDDRISELPKEILHHILGFLEIDEFLIGTTSLVSTRWRNLWKSVSVLKFPTCITSSSSSRRIVDDDNDNGGGGEKYQNFVDHVLRLRDSQASKIQYFRYYCDDINPRRGGCYDHLERLHKLIVSAVVNHGAQEIRIMGKYLIQSGGGGGGGGGNNMIIHFNPSIFTSGELRKFSFQVYNNVHFRIQFPSSMCWATQLTHLTLFEIRLPEGDDDDSNDAAAQQLHLVCPVLEKLFICDCYSEHLKVLDVSAPRLNDLTIYNIKGYDILGECRIEIRTPNLTRLQYYGFVYVDCFMEYLPHLELASLNFISKETGMVEKTTSFATKLLKGLSSAMALILEGFEVFSQDTLRGLLTPFTSLTTLTLVTSCNISSIHGMVHILNNCNSIERFVWKVNEKCRVEGDDEHLMLPQCRLYHLKHVRIEGLLGYKNEIEWVKFLLKNSVVLEDIIIITSAMDSSKRSSIEENLKQFIEEEPSVSSSWRK